MAIRRINLNCRTCKKSIETHPCPRTKIGSKRRLPLEEETIRRIVNNMPGGLLGYCSTWGWLTFARRIERAHKIR